MMTRRLLLLSTVAVLSLIVMSTAEQQPPRQRREPMVGGYSPIQDRNELRAVAAAEFAVTALKTDASAPDYSFKTLIVSPASQEAVNIKIAQGFQQVVAGMNYKMIVVLLQGAECIGSFGVTVWDQFGTLHLTKWGKEIPCDRAKAMLENENDFEGQVSEDDFERY
jgi:hypothetical protein